MSSQQEQINQNFYYNNNQAHLVQVQQAMSFMQQHETQAYQQYQYVNVNPFNLQGLPPQFACQDYINNQAMYTLAQQQAPNQQTDQIILKSCSNCLYANQSLPPFPPGYQNLKSNEPNSVLTDLNVNIQNPSSQISSSIESQQVLQSQTQNENSQIQYQLVICPQFLKKGKCGKGEKCPYSKGHQVCMSFVSQSTCELGEDCVYYHPELQIKNLTIDDENFENNKENEIPFNHPSAKQSSQKKSPIKSNNANDKRQFNNINEERESSGQIDSLAAMKSFLLFDNALLKFIPFSKNSTQSDNTKQHQEQELSPIGYNSSKHLNRLQETSNKISQQCHSLLAESKKAEVLNKSTEGVQKEEDGFKIVSKKERKKQIKQLQKDTEIDDPIKNQNIEAKQISIENELSYQCKLNLLNGGCMEYKLHGCCPKGNECKYKKYHDICRHKVCEYGIELCYFRHEKQASKYQQLIMNEVKRQRKEKELPININKQNKKIEKKPLNNQTAPLENYTNTATVSYKSQNNHIKKQVFLVTQTDKKENIDNYNGFGCFNYKVQGKCHMQNCSFKEYHRECLEFLGSGMCEYESKCAYVHIKK